MQRPSGRFRVSPAICPAETTFHEFSRAVRVHVLVGACAFAVGGVTVEPTAVNIVDPPAGEQRFHARGGGPVEVVRVWGLPVEFWRGREVSPAS